MSVQTKMLNLINPNVWGDTFYFFMARLLKRLYHAMRPYIEGEATPDPHYLEVDRYKTRRMFQTPMWAMGVLSQDGRIFQLLKTAPRPYVVAMVLTEDYLRLSVFQSTQMEAGVHPDSVYHEDDGYYLAIVGSQLVDGEAHYNIDYETHGARLLINPYEPVACFEYAYTDADRKVLEQNTTHVIRN